MNPKSSSRRVLSNWAVNSDALRRPGAARLPAASRRLRLRCTAWKEFSVCAGEWCVEASRGTSSPFTKARVRDAMLGCTSAPGAIGFVGALFALRKRRGCSLRRLAAVRSVGKGTSEHKVTALPQCLRAAQFTRVEHRGAREPAVSGVAHAVQHVSQHGPTTAGGGFAASVVVRLPLRYVAAHGVLL